MVAWWPKHGIDNTLAQTVIADFLWRPSGFVPKEKDVGVVVDKVALGFIFCEY
jgi:hypothetical protein